MEILEYEYKIFKIISHEFVVIIKWLKNHTRKVLRRLDGRGHHKTVFISFRIRAQYKSRRK